MEYPGYSVYKGNSDSLKRIHDDAEIIFKYLTGKIGYSPKQVIILGRSMGSVPAIWLSEKENPGFLILMSAFTCIKDVVNNIAGSLAKLLIKERFNNLNLIKNVICPTLIIHGQKDSFIPWIHSKKLYGNYLKSCILFFKFF